MKKLITLLSLAICLQAFSKPIDETTAKEVGRNFLLHRTTSTKFKSGVVLELVKAESSKARSDNSRTLPVTYYYIFNLSNADGFVIVSGDDNVEPILAYSDESDFNLNNVAPQTQKWLQGYRDEIRHIIVNNIAATSEISNSWQSLMEGKQQEKGFGKKNAGVSPLIQTKWDQAPYYNALCPYDFSASERTVVGCVATAMAQIMKFWNYPQSGSGFHSYNHSKYGTLSADFGSTTYQWSSMPNTVNSTNSAVATLMYHSGISVNMDYDIASQGGSGAYVISSQSPVTNCSEYALKTHFGYKSTLSGVARSSYTNNQWLNLILGELDAGRPVLYAGFGSGGGHAFVCDGYDNNNFLHFNWGWSGQYDGYFSMNALNPGGTGTGGGTGAYNSGHQAVIGIEPPSSSQTFNLNITVDVQASSNTIDYGAAFSVTTNIENEGTNTFNGDYCAAVFDADNIFIDYVQVKTGMSLAGGNTYQNNLVFSSPGSLSLLPADNYKIMIFYRPTGGQWKRLYASGLFTNDYTTVDIVYQNDVEMFADMIYTPSTNLVKGQSASISLDVLNESLTAFTGLLDLSLYDLEGQFVGLIEQKPNINMPSNTHFTSGLTFSTTSLNVPAGTYLLALQLKRNGSSDYELVGSSYHQNPIKITVVEPPFTPDMYENNNTLAQAYSLSLSFSGANATKTTAGSNFHVGNDYDYYKMSLPEGYTYTINPRLQDSYSSNNGQTYSVDGLFSYSLDGATWSDAFDDVIDAPIVSNGGKTIHFLVSPYFTGDVGTYLLDIQLSRTQNVSVDENLSVQNSITLYPNPTSSAINISVTDKNLTVNGIIIYDTNGREVLTTKETANIDISMLKQGLYTVLMETSNGRINKKLTVLK
jgi:hypothetical protein